MTRGHGLDLSAFVIPFVEEARDRLKAIGRAVLRLEATDGDEEAIQDAMRQAHSIKGSAQMLGFTDVSQVAHQLEDLFAAATHHRALLCREAFDLVFAVVDVLAGRLDDLARGDLKGSVDCAPCKALDALIASTVRGMPADGPAPDGAQAHAAPVQAHRAEPRETLRVPLEKIDRLARLAPEIILQRLRAFERYTELRRMASALGRLRDRVREDRLTNEPGASERGSPIAHYGDSLDLVTRELREFLVRFEDDRASLNLITEEFRQYVVELTLRRVASMFELYPRAVRDMAQALDRQVELAIRGGDTELDRRIIERIADPLMHLVRNAVDHGLEPPSERERAGKAACGTVTLSAERVGNRVLISVGDDGRGVDLAALRAAAARAGLAGAEDLERWTTDRLIELIFRPQFSTRLAVSDVSGRGVGLDAVKTAVEGLGGTVRVHSEPGAGTTFTLDLPLSLILVSVMLVEAGGDLFAVPTSAVRRILRAHTRDRQSIDDPVAGETLPVMPLTTILGVSPVPADTPGVVLVAEAGSSRLGLLVDAVHDERELVVKELGGPFRNQRVFPGAAILGNGDIVPILDVSAVIEAAERAPAVEAIRVAGRRAAARRARVLVVDDSLLAAELQKNILIAAGFEAETAPDGVEALEVLQQREWDLVIADVDMPRMDGFELTLWMRADARFRTLPVMIVTSRDSTDDRRRGLDAGADAYVVKREFDQTHFLDTVRRLTGPDGGNKPMRSH